MNIDQKINELEKKYHLPPNLLKDALSVRKGSDLNQEEAEEEIKKLIEQYANETEYLNLLPPEQAQKIINDVIYADKWTPDLKPKIEWDNSIPIPKSWNNAEKDS